MAQTATSKRLAARPAETNPYHRAVPVKGSFSGMSTTEGQRSQRVGQVVAQQHYPVTRRRGHGPEEEEEEGSEGNLTDGGWTDDGAEFDHVDSLGMAPSTVPTNYTPTIVSYVAKRDPAPPPRNRPNLASMSERFTAGELQTMARVGRGPVATHGAEEVVVTPRMQQQQQQQQQQQGGEGGGGGG